MAAERFCCTADQRSSSSSPDLPNAREAHVVQPLMANRGEPTNSRLTSAGTEDMIELRQIFNNAADAPVEESSQPQPEPALKKSRSLARIKSVQALIKRKMSKDLSRHKLNSPDEAAEDTESAKERQEPVGTVVKVPNAAKNAHFKPTKEDLRKNLLSDEEPAKGGYDSDAKVLKDVAKQIGGKSPSKRPSVHDIQWTPSCDSKQTLAHKGHENCLECPSRPTTASRFPDHLLTASSFMSATAPNLCQAAAEERRLKSSSDSPKSRLGGDSPESRLGSDSSKSRLGSDSSQSRLGSDSPKSSTSSTSRLPVRSKPYASSPNLRHAVGKASLNSEKRFTSKPGESSRLRASSPLQSSSPAPSAQKSLATPQKVRSPRFSKDGGDSSLTSIDDTVVSKSSSLAISKPRVLNTELDVDLASTDAFSPRKENSAAKESDKAGQSSEEDKNARNSVHLQNMRISQHLRSGSLLSWGDQSEDSQHDQPFNRIQSGLSLIENLPVRSPYYRNSSTGFDSCNIPSRWGSVLRSERTSEPVQDAEEKSSMYSSRPQSPPDSPGFLPIIPPLFSHGYQPVSMTDDAATASVKPAEALEDDETPKASNQTIIGSTKTPNTDEQIQTSNVTEETPEPFKRRLPKSKSFMRFLRPHSRAREDVRSQSDGVFVDGPDDDKDAARGRQMSRSMLSLRTEQEALERQPDSSNMWEKALKAYHEERSSMFLSPNKALATRGSPFRERSSSFARQHPFPETPATERSDSPGAGLLTPSSRRAAAVAHDLEVDPMAEVRKDFHAQTESSASVRAWGKYPSHSRSERTGSAGAKDRVQTRDFALENAINFAMGADVDPADPSPESAQGKKKKKKVTTAISQSQSVSLGRQFIRNYTRMFRSQSTEFRRHGHGHRTSIAAGGTLEYPELEILPEVFASTSEGHGSSDDPSGTNGAVDAVHDGAQDVKDVKGKQKADVQPTSGQTSRAPTVSTSILGPPSEPRSSVDRARIWSNYYEDCVAGFPPVTDLDLKKASSAGASSLKDNNKVQSASARQASGLSADKSNETSASLPSRVKASHGRNVSGVSAISEASGLSGSKSVSSVRKSTLDLLQQYRRREQEERQRVLSFFGSDGY